MNENRVLTQISVNIFDIQLEDYYYYCFGSQKRFLSPNVCDDINETDRKSNPFESAVILVTVVLKSIQSLFG